MVTVGALLALICVNISNGQAPSRTPQIHWVQSPQQATALAQQFNTPILAYVTSKHCGYCRKMERETWSNPQIIAMVDGGFIPLELNAERDAELISSLRISAFPTTLLFTPDAQYLAGAPGYQSPTQLAALLKRVQHPEIAAQHVQASQ